MKRRIFIAISIPEKVKKRLVDYGRKWIDLDSKLIRWTKKDNLHITLLFIGYVDNDVMYEIIEKAKKIAKNHNPFNINFERIVLGPPNRTPRMFWVQGEESEELGKLQGDLLNEIGLRSGRNNALRPHITLSRFRSGLDLPKDLNESFQAQIPVETIEIMQSNLKRSGAEHTILESIELG